MYEDEEDTASLQRANTTQIRQTAQFAGKASVATGLCIVLCCSLVGAVYIHYGYGIPDSCESDMKTVFMAMGIMSILQGFVALCATYAAKEFFSAMSHKALVDKWGTDQTHAEEIEEEQEEYESDMRRAGGCGSALLCVSCILMPCMFCFSIYGIIQASEGTNENCNDSITVFWVLLVLNMCTSCGQCGKQGNQQQQARGSG